MGPKRVRKSTRPGCRPSTKRHKCDKLNKVSAKDTVIVETVSLSSDSDFEEIVEELGIEMIESDIKNQSDQSQTVINNNSVNEGEINTNNDSALNPSNSEYELHIMEVTETPNKPKNPLKTLFESENIPNKIEQSAKITKNNTKPLKTPTMPARAKQPSVTLNETSTLNRYSPLAALPDSDLEPAGDDENESEQRTANATSNPSALSADKNINKQKIPSPIIIKGKTSRHHDLIERIKEDVKGEFSIKYSANNTNLYIKNTTDKQTFLTTLKEAEVEYHTYSDCKTHAFVLSGLTVDKAEQDIKHELKTIYNIDVEKVYKMRGTYRLKYLVVTKDNIKINKLQNEVRYLMYTRITWERHINKKLITQCYRCQMWGHATSNCQRQERCVKCGKDHISKSCQKPLNVAATCANCQGSHPASSTECSYYKNALALSEARRIKNGAKTTHVKYVPAPTPTQSVWELRKQILEQQKQQERTTSTSRKPVPNNDTRNFPNLPIRSTRITHRRIPSTSDSDTGIITDTNTHKHYTKTRNTSDKNHTQHRTHDTNTATGKLEDFRMAVKELNSIINIDKMIEHVKELTNILLDCETESQKLMAMMSYFSKLDG